ncbi:hypothetical protein CXB65_24930 [Pseudomonas monteilii]|jgi:hypothetical protein|uniref:Uncharacterized protein n=1 Tax=Pseudomonas monteilii TaxID=76759 RepID=A0A2N1IK88_9PSED|nr:hypothetical protein CXB65_24930 [Pseudomonas monteilii]RPD95147.1 hypothetical protein EGN69_03645 [Pseudomonas monteilii]TFW25619.1 hypothetical protein E4L40_04660 [Pseudomonas putida]
MVTIDHIDRGWKGLYSKPCRRNDNPLTLLMVGNMCAVARQIPEQKARKNFAIMAPSIKPRGFSSVGVIEAIAAPVFCHAARRITQ